MSFFNTEDENYAGTLRITNMNTLEKWLKNGEYQTLIDQGYFYNVGCGRFRKEICTCHKCRNKKRTTTLLKLEKKLLSDGYKSWCYVMLNVSELIKRGREPLTGFH